MAENQGPITQDQLDIARQFEESAKRAAASYREMAADAKVTAASQLSTSGKSQAEIDSMLATIERAEGTAQSVLTRSSASLTSFRAGVAKQSMGVLRDVYSGIDGLFSNTQRGLGQGMELIANATATMAEGVGDQLDGIPSKFANVVGTMSRLAGGVIGETERFAIGLTRQYERKFVEPFVRINNNIRSNLGSLSQGAGRAAVTMRRGLGGSLRRLGITTNFFGVGAKGAAERARFLAESLTELGSTADVALGNFGEDQVIALGTFSKAYRLGAATVQGLTKNLLALGGDPVKAISQIIGKSNEFGNRFGITANFITKDISTMMADFGRFGNLSINEMAAASTFARKLGTDIKQLVGVIDRFDDFEAAATNVAKLSQAFGVNVDAVKMMNAENPAERVQMLRDAFFAAGKSAENMTRQELSLIQSQTGLDAATARLVFSQKNRFQGERDLQKQMEKRKSREQEIKEAPLKMAESFRTLSRTLEHVFIGIGDKLQLFSDNLMMSPAGKSIMSWARGVSHESAEQLGRVGTIIGNMDIAKQMAAKLAATKGPMKESMKTLVDVIEQGAMIMDMKAKGMTLDPSHVEAYKRQLDLGLETLGGEEKLGADHPAVQAVKAMKAEIEKPPKIQSTEALTKAMPELGLSAGQSSGQGYAEGWTEAVKAAAPEMMSTTLESIQQAQQAESPALLFTPAGLNSAMGWMKGWIETTTSPEFAQHASEALMTPIARIASIDNMQLQPVSDALSTIGKNAENVKAQLANLNVEVDNFAKSGVSEMMGKGALTVDTKGFIVQINVNAKMDAHDIATAIAKPLSETEIPASTPSGPGSEGMSAGSHFVTTAQPAGS